MDFSKDRLDGGISLDHGCAHSLMQGFFRGMPGFGSGGVPFGFLGSKDGGVVFCLLMERLELLAFAFRQTSHPCGFMVSWLLPSIGDTCISSSCDHRRRSSALTDWVGWVAIVFACPFWRHHFCKDWFDGRIDSHHRIMH